MKSTNRNHTDTRSAPRDDDHDASYGHVDQHFAELIEVVWSCERQWALENRIEAAIRVERQHPSRGEIRCD